MLRQDRWSTYLNTSHYALAAKWGASFGRGAFWWHVNECLDAVCFPRFSVFICSCLESLSYVYLLVFMDELLSMDGLVM